jgi:hypothetical protein
VDPVASKASRCYRERSLCKRMMGLAAEMKVFSCYVRWGRGSILTSVTLMLPNLTVDRSGSDSFHKTPSKNSERILYIHLVPRGSFNEILVP